MGFKALLHRMMDKSNAQALRMKGLGFRVLGFGFN